MTNLLFSVLDELCLFVCSLFITLHDESEKKLKRKRKPELKETVSQKRTQLYSNFFAIRPPLSQGETVSTRKGIVDKKFD